MNPETLRAFYRIYPSGSYAGRIIEFKFSPIDRRFPKQEFFLRYSIASRSFDAVSVSMERKGRRSPHDTIDPGPLAAALPPRMLADLVTRSIEEEAKPKHPAHQILHGFALHLDHLKDAAIPICNVQLPEPIPSLSIKFTTQRDPARYENLVADVVAQIKETADAPEDGHRKQAAGRQDGAHVRATVLRRDDRSEGDR